MGHHQGNHGLGRKLAIALIPLIITAAFGVMVAGAQAEKAVWLKNATVLQNGVVESTVSWGTVTLNYLGGITSCKTASAGSVENNAATPNGNTGDTLLFVAYECRNTGGECTAHGGEEKVIGENLPWTGSYLEEGGGSEGYRTTEANQKVTLNVECVVGNTLTGRLAYKAGPVNQGQETGTWEPALVNGSSLSKPSELSFDAKAGHLLASQEIEEPAPIIIENAKTTAGSNVVKGTKFVSGGVKVGQIVLGATGTDVPIPTSLDKSPEPLTGVASVTETEIVLDELHFNGTGYESTANPIDANATGAFTLQFNSGSGKFQDVHDKMTIQGKFKLVGLGAASGQLALLTLAP
jgi:hypothetical protein